MNSTKLKGIARHLTGTELQDLISAYNQGVSSIIAPRGQVLDRQDVAFIGKLLGVLS